MIACSACWWLGRLGRVERASKIHQAGGPTRLRQAEGSGRRRGGGFQSSPEKKAFQRVQRRSQQAVTERVRARRRGDGPRTDK